MNIEELEAPAPAMDRQCSKCLAVKPFTIVHWPNNRGKPTGMVCRLCLREAQRSYDRTTRKSARIAVRAAANAVPSAVLAAPASAVVPAKNEAAASVAKLPVRKLDVTRALDAGATVVNESAKGVLETVLGYAMDATSVHHEWALKLLAERAIPRKLYEDLGLQAVGVKPGQGGQRPVVTIIVQPAASPGGADPSIKTIEGEAERVVDGKAD